MRAGQELTNILISERVMERLQRNILTFFRITLSGEKKQETLKQYH